MRVFFISIFVIIVLVCFFYIAIVFLSKDGDNFSTNLNGNVSGRDGEKEVVSPISIFNGIVGIK
tara:strand:- start:4368 stop:4559 length:192 start_codon:yes stop_codon:yes gene_type:complete